MKQHVLADRMEDLSVESAFTVVADVSRMLEVDPSRQIVPLHVGEPYFTTPINIARKAFEAMTTKDLTHYTPPRGLPQTREAAADYVQRKTGVPTGAANIVITPGSKFIFEFALQALVNEGVGVIYPDPGYAPYAALIKKQGSLPIPVPLRASNEFRLDVRDVVAALDDCASRGIPVKMLVLNSPANPTGGVLTEEDCRAIAKLAKERDLYVISDEIYSRLIYDGGYASVYQQPGMAERTILMDGCSKAWAMCGWRLGFGAMPEEIAIAMGDLMINTASCAPSMSQWAAIEAFQGADSDAFVEMMSDEFRGNRDLLVAGLCSLENVECHSPAGAFYVFADISQTGWDDHELANALLQDDSLAAIWGSSFGEQGKGYIRFSYARQRDHIQVALEKLGAFLQTRAPSVQPSPSSAPASRVLF
jgi:aspartate aminotransferase